jgi:hypothetical protein
MDFQEFCDNYQHEVKENYLLREIGNALQKISTNRKICDYLLKQIDAHMWARDHELPQDVVTEFDQHIKALNIACNDRTGCANEDWDAFQMCLKHLSKQDLNAVRHMLLI